MPDPVGPSIAGLCLIILSAFTYACTAALPAVNETALNEQGDSAEKRRTQRMLRRMDSGRGELRLTQLTLTLCACLFFVFTGWLLRGLLGGLIAFALFLVLDPVLSLMLPGSLAAKYPIPTLRFTAPVADLCVTALSPLTALSWLLVKPLLLLPRVSPALSAEHVTEEDIRELVDIGEESGAIEADEKQMIENVFELNNLTAADCMIHRKDIRAIDADSTDDEIRSLIIESGLSRFPVYEDTVDNVIGILTARDFLLNDCSDTPVPWRDLLRKAHFVPESVRVDTLLSQMQSAKQHMAVVIDEYGGTSGVITLEDLIEEIVGNIYDEFDPKEEQEITRTGENTWRVSGADSLEAINEVLGTHLPESEEYESLGGLVFSRLTEIPSDGERPVIELDGARIRVTEIADRRVEWAIIEIIPKEGDK